MFYDRLDRHRAGYFTVRFSSHSIGEHKKVQWRHNAEAILIVGPHATYIGHAAANDLHADSPARAGYTPPACLADDPFPTLTDSSPSRQPLNPNDYSHLRHLLPVSPLQRARLHFRYNLFHVALDSHPYFRRQPSRRSTVLESTAARARAFFGPHSTAPQAHRHWRTRDSRGARRQWPSHAWCHRKFL